MRFKLFRWMHRKGYVSIANQACTTRTLRYPGNVDDLLEMAWNSGACTTLIVKDVRFPALLCRAIRQTGCGDFEAGLVGDGTVSLRFVRHGVPERKLVGPLAPLAYLLG